MKPVNSVIGKPSYVDSINILLMVVSFIVALKIPFTLFLVAYAVLGPLHYLTEIFWLNKHEYYLNNKKDHRWLIIISVLVTVVTIGAGMPSVLKHAFVQANVRNLFSALIFIGFVAAIAFTVFKKNIHKLIAIGITLIVAALLWKSPAYMLLFGVFLTTIVHVCFFTAAFILFGALKSKSIVGYLSILVYIGCVVLFFIIPIYKDTYALSTYEYNAITKSGFGFMNMNIAEVFDSNVQKPYNLLSEQGIRIQCFVAFAYTYHYLNWFSKVEIIKWNKIPSRLKIITIVTWLLAIALYAYDYKIGLLALFLLSLLHVFLEFPLNTKTFIGIGNELKKKWK